MGVLDYISEFFSVAPSTGKKRKPMQTVEIKVKMDCDGCERRVRNSVVHMKGQEFNAVQRVGLLIMITGSPQKQQNQTWVKQVEVNRKQSKITVTGYVERNRVLKKVQSTGKRADFWPYIPYNLVAYPYVAQAYDKKAPSGYVKNSAQALPAPNSLDEKLTSLFSDENPNACSIM